MSDFRCTCAVLLSQQDHTFATCKSFDIPSSPEKPSSVFPPRIKSEIFSTTYRPAWPGLAFLTCFIQQKCPSFFCLSSRTLQSHGFPHSFPWGKLPSALIWLIPLILSVSANIPSIRETSPTFQTSWVLWLWALCVLFAWPCIVLTMPVVNSS